MKSIIILLHNDIRQVIRDKTLFFFLLIPIIIIAFIKYFVPYLTNLYPNLEAFHYIFLLFGGIQISSIFGFIIAFLILEDKDTGVIKSIQVLPLSFATFIFSRLLGGTFISLIFTVIFVLSVKIISISLINTMLFAIQSCLIVPFLALSISSLSKNKVEGMAFAKASTLILQLPLVSILFSGNFQYAFAISPTFFTIKFLEVITIRSSSYIFAWYFMGIFFYMLYFIIFMLFFYKKNKEV